MEEEKKIARKEDEMSFLDHLEHLRWHIIRALTAIIVAAVGVFLAKDFIFHTVLFGPKQEDFVTYRFLCGLSSYTCFRPTPFDLITRDLGEEFVVHLKSSFWIGLIIAFPYVLYEIWQFVKPGLYEKERNAITGIVFICSVLFFIGVSFGYFVISPFAVSFLSSYDVGAINAPTLASYINYIAMLTLPTGLIFELPVFSYFLAKMGIVDGKAMRAYRKHAAVIILIIGAIITPPDWITQLLIAAPLFILYEISIIIADRVYPKV